MGTKTKPNSNGFIETIIYGHENGENGHEHDDAMDGYETDHAGELIDGEGNEDPTPITTPAEEAARAEEFPAVVQAGMWVRLTRDVEIENDDSSIHVFEEGFIGQVVASNEPDLPMTVQGSDSSFLIPYLAPGDLLPLWMEQVNAPEPATLPDSTPMDDLDGENAEPSEAETVYTAATTATTTQATSAHIEELGNLYDLAAEAQRISFKLGAAKEVVKELREELDDANSKLRAAALALKWSREPEPELFRQRDVDSDHDADTFTAAESQVPPTTSTKATPDESWRLISIDVLNLPGKIPEQLREHHPSLDTIGAIVDFVNTPFTYLTDVKGIGQGKAEKIADALEAFWKNRNAKPTNTPDPTSTEQGAAAFDSGMTLDDNPHPRGSGDWDEWRAGFKDRAGMGEEDEAVGDEDL